MSNYFIDRNFRAKKYKKLEFDEGYVFKPHIKNTSLIRVAKVKFFERDMLDKILSAKFDRTFKQLISLALKVLNDDDATQGDTEIVLGEVELVREILLNRYDKFIAYEKEKLFLKKLRVIDNELRMKQIQIKRRDMLRMMQEEMSIGRGR